VSVQDVAKVLVASAHDERLNIVTVPIIGPEELTLKQAVRRVAAAVDKHPLYLPAPIAVHRGLAWVFERIMNVPLESAAQVRILTEGIVEPVLAPDRLPDDLLPTTPFSLHAIHDGLPPKQRFTLADLRAFPGAS
jgi:uncharacterized protein YbjT (DUF2867 family)